MISWPSCYWPAPTYLQVDYLLATGAPLHGTSPDGTFTVTTVECAGACANAPMFDLDGVYHEDLTPEKAKQIVRSVK